MGRKLNVSTPTVINTELIPLTESFYVEADGQLEQWYYENDGRYAPNRKVTPMTLTPHISAFDKDTNTTYTPSLYIVRWYELAWNETQQDYVETEITNSVDSLSADYVKVGNNLLVKKNVGYTHSVTISCRAQYIDPRDSGITYGVNDSVLLTTNRDATVMTPELDIKCPSSQAFNPLTDNHIDENTHQVVYDSEFTMKATSDMSSVLATDISQYKVDPFGTEEVIPTNETAIVTSAPTMDIRYGDYEQTGQTFMRRQVSGGQIPYIAGNMAYVNKIKGNTVKYNQLIKSDRAQSTHESSGITWRVLSDGRVVANGTATAQSQFIIYPDSVTLGFKGVNGHKYYSYIISGGSEDSYYGRIISNGGGIANRLGSANITTCIDSEKGTGIILRVANGATVNNVVFYPMLIDLTALGIDNLTTTAEVESWLAANIGLKSYYPYNAGELIPVKMSAIKSSGFNLWDEEWEVGIYDDDGQKKNAFGCIRSANKIPVLPLSTYYVGNIVGRVMGFSQDSECIGRLTITNNCVTIPQDCALITINTARDYGETYNNNICINLSDPSRNGTYEAHWEAEQYLPITELKGKVNGTGDSVVIFPNGMNRVGDVYDEIKVEDGVIKAIKRFERVDLGSLTWVYQGGESLQRFYTENVNSIIKKVTDDNEKGNIICAIYATSTVNATGGSTNNMIIGVANSGNMFLKNLSKTGSDLTSGHASWLDGVYLVYELATPVEYIIDNMPRGQFEWYGISNNQEVLVETLPWYKSGQHTDTLVVDAMCGEEIRVVLRARVSAGANRLYPNKVYRSIEWRIPDVDINAYSENGGAVRGNTISMDFDTIVNLKGATMSDAVKQDNIRFNWKVRKSNSDTEVDHGWGQKRTIPASALRNSIGSSSSLASTLVLPYGYVLGANEVVTDSSEVVTDNGEPVYDRPVF